VSQQLEQRLGTRNGNGLLLVIQLVLSDFVWIASSNLRHILIIRMARLIMEEVQKVECGGEPALALVAVYLQGG